MDRGEKGRGGEEGVGGESISRPGVCVLQYERGQIPNLPLSHKEMVQSTPITETPRKEKHLETDIIDNLWRTMNPIIHSLS